MFQTTQIMAAIPMAAANIPLPEPYIGAPLVVFALEDADEVVLEAWTEVVVITAAVVDNATGVDVEVMVSAC